MTDFVLDCSVSMTWWFEDETDAYAERVLDYLDEASAVVPAIWPLEVANALLVAERRNRITSSDSDRVAEFIVTLPIHVDDETHPSALGATMALAREYALTAYDAAYLELAMRLDLPLATADKVLAKAARAGGVPHFE